MRFDLGTLDSGERSLPFGLLVHLKGVLCILIIFLLEIPVSSVDADQMRHLIWVYTVRLGPKNGMLGTNRPSHERRDLV